MKKIRVVELFAGVGGFRIGLDAASTKNIKFETIWNNQWEPGANKQYASDVYKLKFGQAGHSNVNIEKVIENDFENIPDHDLLVGGFPCQDYSVARTLSQSKGLIGEKGILWWSIYTILKRKGAQAPNYIFLENVDRLLKSPAKQRGRDFAIILASLSDLGYAVEWRVINAADYGFPQRRRRVFIIGYKQGTSAYEKITKSKDKESFILNGGVAGKAFPCVQKTKNVNKFKIEGKLTEISKQFAKSQPAKSLFYNSGVMIDREVVSKEVEAVYSGKKIVLGDILQKESEVPEEFFIHKESLGKWKYLKGAKKELRTTKAGHTYYYSEGGMIFPDALDGPARTIVTGEGGSTPSRFKHVIKTESGRLRRLTPLELERLDMFPDNHTAGIPDARRAFLMGNALVVGVIERFGKELLKVM